GSVGGYAQYVDHQGNAIGGGHGSTLGFSYDPNPSLSPYKLAEGRPPAGPDEVVMDKATADKHHFKIGDRVLVNLPNSARNFTISGIVTFGSADNLAGITLAGFDAATAQRLFNSEGRYNTIEVLAAPSTDQVRLQRSIARVLPPGYEVVSGQTLTNELTSEVDQALSFISTALEIFAAIALFVGAFTIFNTFSITITQRTRELALLRVVGASRSQLLRSVLGEAALTGLAASLVGLGLGVGAAAGLKALLGAFGVTLPSAALVFETRTVVVALAVGMLVTLLAAIVPARRAISVAPVAALGHRGGEPPGHRRRKSLAGGVIGAAGLVVLGAGIARPSVGLVGIGAVVTLIAAGVLAPIVARPVARVVGRPVAAPLGPAGDLGLRNSIRDPARTARTAGALMIGMTLVSAIAVLGSSLSTSTKQSIDSAIRADYIVSGSGGFSRSVVPAVSRLRGVATATTIYSGQFEFRGTLSKLVAATPAGLDQTVDLHLSAGSTAPALAAGDLLIDANTARADGLHVGSRVAVDFARTGPATMRIGGIYDANPLVGSYVCGAPFFVSHFDNALPSAVLIRAAPGATGLGARLSTLLVPYANVGYKTRAQFDASQQNTINTELDFVYVMLALAVVIALIGIVNTLMLSVFERTHEIGLLRAVGMGRRQVRSMIRVESVIVALFGAVVGIVLGAVLGISLAESLRNSGVGELSVPVVSLIAFVIVAALLGLGAATWPARRAAQLDVLAAIATE
ncbi:MAG: ABC transporter permease, partial [Solirubrobacteraceae bacterium]